MSSNTLAPILEDSVGPYFPHAFTADFRNDLTRHAGLIVRPDGEFVRLEGTVRDAAGDPVAPVLVEFWQANGSGRHRTPHNAGDRELDPWFDGFGRQYSEDGVFQLTTVRPGSVEAGDSQSPTRAPHVTITIFCDGISKLVTQIFFAGDPGNDTDPLLASLPTDLATRLIAEPAGQVEGVAVFQRDIVLRGENETPFFDDMES